MVGPPRGFARVHHAQHSSTLFLAASRLHITLLPSSRCSRPMPAQAAFVRHAIDATAGRTADLIL